MSNKYFKRFFFAVQLGLFTALTLSLSVYHDSQVSHICHSQVSHIYFTVIYFVVSFILSYSTLKFHPHFSLFLTLKFFTHKFHPVSLFFLLLLLFIYFSYCVGQFSSFSFTISVHTSSSSLSLSLSLSLSHNISTKYKFFYLPPTYDNRFHRTGVRFCWLNQFPIFLTFYLILGF